jgi:hypothetical protein
MRHVELHPSLLRVLPSSHSSSRSVALNKTLYPVATIASPHSGRRTQVLDCGPRARDAAADGGARAVDDDADDTNVDLDDADVIFDDGDDDDNDDDGINGGVTSTAAASADRTKRFSPAPVGTVAFAGSTAHTNWADSTRHRLLQPSPLPRLPSSHSSCGGLTTPLPQSTSTQARPAVAHAKPGSIARQSAAHPSPPTVLPSSQTSPSAELSTPSPQRAHLVVEVGPSVGTHVYPVSTTHLELHPSLEMVLPSSQPSRELAKTPSPHRQQSVPEHW